MKKKFVPFGKRSKKEQKKHILNAVFGKMSSQSLAQKNRRNVIVVPILREENNYECL